MREILFRGIRTDNNKLVYGHLVKIKNSQHKETYGIKDTIYHVNSGSCDLIPEEVIPETVGQYTARFDIKKTRAFEGDIFLNQNDVKMTIEYSEEQCMFRARSIKNPLISKPLCEVEIKEIQGNIHQHKRLMK